MNKIKPSDIPKMLKLKNKGWTLRRIADKYGLHNSTISYYFSKLKVKYFKCKRGPKKKIVKVKKKQKYIPSVRKKPVKMHADYVRIDEERKRKLSSK